LLSDINDASILGMTTTASTSTHGIKTDNCPLCGRHVRVRTDGRLFKHLMKLANKSRGATECPNRQRGGA
jgi:hypothetical protein